MDASRHDGHVGQDKSNGSAVDQDNEDNSDVLATVATVGVVGLGVAVFEAALLPGMILGVAAMWAPQYFPKMGKAVQPLFRSTVRGAYKVGQKTKEFVAETQEQMHDIVAEVHAEDERVAASPKRSKSAIETH